MDADERYLCQLSDRNLHATLRDTTSDSGLNVLERLVGDTLRKRDWYVRICQRTPWLTPERQKEVQDLGQRAEEITYRVVEKAYLH